MENKIKKAVDTAKYLTDHRGFEMRQKMSGKDGVILDEFLNMAHVLLRYSEENTALRARITEMKSIKGYPDNYVSELTEKIAALKSEKVKKQPPDLTAGEFNRREC
ncbi:MAG TPA: hypothetical protein VLH56_11520 [Dissulfurispiraceae bacterium]|nr:hypothetical protein [Dissulfurispiraceae bacterium]